MIAWKPLVRKRLDGHFDVVDHQRHGRPAGRTQEQGVDLRDVHLGRQQGRADLQHRLRRIGQLDADQVGLDDRQPGPLENLAARFGIAQQEPHQGTFGRIGDRQGDDPHIAALEAADHVHQLADAVLEKDRELADRRVVAATHRGEVGPRSFSGTHGDFPSRWKAVRVWRDGEWARRHRTAGPRDVLNCP